MSSPFAFDIQFSPRESAARDALDQVAEAEIGLFAGDLCLTALKDRMAKTVRPTFRASTYRLAFWLAENCATKTARQKFQRAFAQQLLCPVEDLKAFLDTEHPSDDHIEEAAAEFDVSPLLIKTTLVNQGWLGRELLQAF